jgi:hypothetical protein
MVGHAVEKASLQNKKRNVNILRTVSSDAFIRNEMEREYYWVTVGDHCGKRHTRRH